MKLGAKYYIALTILSLSAFSFAEKSRTEPSPAEELARLYAEDQADRDPSNLHIDWEAVSMRDEQREIRVKKLLSLGSLGGGTEYYRAAMILQHASTPDDYLLAHDLCVIAISKGEKRAMWLAAASLDRFLVSIGRAQRFGTQYRSNKSFRPPQLVAVDPNVSDTLRHELGVPTLAEAKKRGKEMEKGFYESRKKKAD